METGKAKLRDTRIYGCLNWVLMVSFSPDSQTIISESEDKTIRMWDVKSGQEMKGTSGRVDTLVDNGTTSQSQRTLLPGKDPNLVAFSFAQAPSIVTAPYCDDGQWRICTVLNDERTIEFLHAV